MAANESDDSVSIVSSVYDEEHHAEMNAMVAENVVYANNDGIHPEMAGFIVPDDAPGDGDDESETVPTLLTDVPAPTPAELAAARTAFEQRSEARFMTAEDYDIGSGDEQEGRTGATRFAAVLSRWEDRLLTAGQLPPDPGQSDDELPE